MLVTVLLAVGAAALVLAFLPGGWPNPLPQGPVASARSVDQLRAAAAAIDAACARGDLQGFVDAVTPAHRERLSKRLAIVDRALDEGVLRELGDTEQRYVELLQRPLLAGEVRGARAVVAVPRPAGDGAQILSFVWDGRVLRLDDSHQVVSLRSRAAAEALVAEACAREPK